MRTTAAQGSALQVKSLESFGKSHGKRNNSRKSYSTSSSGGIRRRSTSTRTSRGGGRGDCGGAGCYCVLDCMLQASKPSAVP